MDCLFVRHYTSATMLTMLILQALYLGTGQCCDDFEGEWFIISDVDIPNKDGWSYCGDYVNSSEIKQEYNKVEKIVIKVIDGKYDITFDSSSTNDNKQAADKIDKVFAIKKIDEWLVFRRITYMDDDENGVASLFSIRVVNKNRLEGWWQKGTLVNVQCIGHKPSGNLTGFKNAVSIKKKLH